MMMTVKYSEMQGDQILRVHSAAIHIEHKATLTQQKMWLYLLYRAYQRLNERVVHEVELPDVRRFLGTKMTGTNEFKTMLKALIGISLEWNIFGKDNEKWEAMPLLSYCAIEKRGGRNVIRYRYTEELSERLYDPEMYVKINLLMSQNFKGKHAFNLYLLALDYLRVKNGNGFKHFTIAEIRKYLGIKPGDYTAIYDFKRYVLRPAEKEINEKSDITIKITDLPADGKGGKITGFRLEMWIKEGFPSAYQSPEGVPRLAVEPAADVFHFPEAVANFHTKYDVDTDAKPFREALEQAKAAVGEDIAAYLLYVIEKVKKKSAFLENVAGFYVSQIDDDSYLHAFKRQKTEKASREQVEMAKLSDLVEQELKKEHQKHDRKKFIEFISERLPDFELKISTLLHEHANSFVLKAFKEKFGGRITRESVSYVTISPTLHQFAEDFSYKSEDYDAWRSAFVGNPKNSTTIEHMHQAAKLELKRA